MNLYTIAENIVSHNANDYRCEQNCAEFVSTALTVAGVDSVSSISCTDMYHKLSATKDWSRVPHNCAKQGDIIMFSWDKTQSRPVDHVGIVKNADANNINYANMNGSISREYSIDYTSANSTNIWAIFRHKDSNTTAYTNVSAEYSTRLVTNKLDTVVTLQRMLKGVGCECGLTDGQYGCKTENAVKEFQKRKGLDIDGIAGKDTITELTKEYFNI